MGHFSTFFILLFIFLRTQCPSIQTMQLSALLWDRWALWNQGKINLKHMYICTKSLFEFEFECYCLIRLLKNSSHRCTLWYSSDWVHNIWNAMYVHPEFIYFSGVLNSALNPIIYAFWYKHFRKSSIRLLNKCACKVFEKISK